MTGIIDIGSNTIRLVVYENGEKIKEKALRSDIISDTNDNILSKKGIDNLCNSILYLISDIENTDIYALATEAVRLLSNKEEVKSEIFKKTGLEIDILSGEEEAECVFLGMISEIEEARGICVDLGGGSIECIEFENRKITFAKSYPLGCKKVKSEKELEIIEKKEICGNLYIAGGTGKTSLKILGKTDNVIKIEEIKDLISFLQGLPEEKLQRMIPDRYDTIITGLMIMKKLLEIYNKKEIYIIKNGVREGYLIKKV